jgi:hypothetical protein
LKQLIISSSTCQTIQRRYGNGTSAREAKGDTDRAAQLQSNVMPEFGNNLIGFQIEFCFNYSHADDGSSYLARIEGVIESIVNTKQRTVIIRWNKDKVAEGDLHVTKHTNTGCYFTFPSSLLHRYASDLDGLTISIPTFAI